MADFAKVYPFTLRVEGPYQRIANDDGNWSSGRCGHGVLIGTKGGISAPILAQARGSQVTATDMKNLTTAEVIAIAKKFFFDKIRGNDLPSGVDLMTFDMHYNSGCEGPKGLQHVLNVQEDGAIGDATLKAIDGSDPVLLVSNLSQTAALELQRKIGVVADGNFGPVSVDALLATGLMAKSYAICAALHDEYELYYRSCKNFSQFGRGWISRNDARQIAANKLIAGLSSS